MAKVSLRIYNREIDRLIEQGQIDEAVAHCRHILQTFPKHLETYRMLGKAYLEAKQYEEAVDVFGRVLMAVPGDFVSHVGLSIINDEQNKLDDAIWHMERAFEEQPSNAAIQGELQRLYGRRDGTVPPKVRMTRGALAHMYVQGELFPQAIAEIRAVLTQDPQRTDMQSLLAFSYFKSGQKAEAAELCRQFVQKYPYSFDANRILLEIETPEKGGGNAQTYRVRIGEMDPYAALVTDSVFSANEVSDSAVNLEKLEYIGGDSSSGKGWTPTLGIELESASTGLAESAFDGQPDWLKAGGFNDDNQPISSALPTAPAEGAVSNHEDDMPDSLREAGWGESTSTEQPVSFLDESTAEIGDEPTPVDLPDWLKDTSTQQTQAPLNIQPESDSLTPSDPPDRLGPLENAQPNLPAREDPLPVQPSSSEEELPDWLGSLGVAAATAAISQPQFETRKDIPEWLSGLGDTEATPSEQQPNDSPTLTDAPDWLSFTQEDSEPIKSMSPEPEVIPEASVPDWLSHLDETAKEETVSQDEWISEVNVPPEAQEASLPDQIQTAEPRREIPSVESLGTSAQKQEDGVAWLESLAAKYEAKQEETVSDSNQSSDTPPEWVAQVQTIHPTLLQDEISLPSSKEIKSPQEESPSQSTGLSSQELDDAIAWLESLAEKHGAQPEELVTDPTGRSETPPEWIQQVQSQGGADLFEGTAPQIETQNNEQDLLGGFASLPESAADETGTWFDGLDQKEKATHPSATEDSAFEISPDLHESLDLNSESMKSTESTSDVPAWLKTAGQESPVENGVHVSQNLSKQDLADWLSSLDDEPGLDMDPEPILSSARPPIPPVTQPVSSPPVSEPSLPNWLNEPSPSQELEEEIVPESSVPTAETVLPSLEADLPDWLQEADESNLEQAEEDLPPWLHRERYEAEEPKQPTPTSPSDWHPVEPKPKSEPLSKQQPDSGVFVQPAKVTPAMTNTLPAPESREPLPVEKKKPVKSVRPQKIDSSMQVNILVQAKGELERGDIPAALDHYGRLIKKGKNLEETIRDLTESLYRYPVEVGIWQTLGDAYMRANRLKEALESYNKAEELIR